VLRGRMKNHALGRPNLPERTDCTRRRLAEGGLASVDVCSCGTLQVHIGALSLRLDEGALSELVATLGHALERHAIESRAPARIAVPVFGAGGPGEA
jgi:hypothetical protein